jgi:N-acetylmuramoyl-L-alanine amidase
VHGNPPTRLSRAELLLGGIGLLAGAWPLRRFLSAAPAFALSGAAVSVIPRDEPLAATRGPAGAGRELAQREAPRFTLVGVHWRGAGEVSFRTRGVGGAWSEWQAARVHELPDPGSSEERRLGWRLGTPVWVGEADAIQYRTTGGVSQLRSYFVWSPPAATPRRLAAAGTPTIVPRSGWGADESIVRAGPQYAESLRFAVVHHTAGKLPSTPAESAAIVRGVQAYHVKGNGWNDIGYNFLVDPFGQVFEGRIGGIDRNVVGAHALGFNTGSVGVALLGNYEQELVAAEAIAGLASLLSWRLDVGHVDPLALVSAVSSSGEPRTIRAISGHRDVNNTACPGATLYPQLDGLAQQVAATGLPKLYDPRVEQPGPGVYRFTARLSDARAWSLAVAGPGGEVARGTGLGNLVDFTWDSTTAAADTYTWTIEAGPDVRPATGSLPIGVVLPPTAPAQPPPPAPARPGTVPRKVPRWAWELRAWHLTPKARRGTRPGAAPRRIPRWYWAWYRWRAAVDLWADQNAARRS